MNKLKANYLPLTVSNCVISKKEFSNLKDVRPHCIKVEKFQVDKVEVYSFYKPISKIL